MTALLAAACGAFVDGPPGSGTSAEPPQGTADGDVSGARLDGDHDGIDAATDCDDHDATLGSVHVDRDCDGIADSSDNCPEVANLRQQDTDGNGAGDACRWLAVATGTEHVCALRADGQPVCWGENGSGEASPPDGQLVAVTAGYARSCGLRPDLSPVCWGRDSDQAPPDPLVAMSAGFDHTCGIGTDGRPICWPEASPHRSRAPSLDGFTLLDAGWNVTCGLRDEGRLHCWGGGWHAGREIGTDLYRALGAEEWVACAIRLDDDRIECSTHLSGDTDRSDHIVALLTPPAGAFLDVAMGRYHGCALDKGGSIACWGTNEGAGPTSPAPTGTFTALDAGLTGTCALGTDASLRCWGRGFDAILPEGRFRQVAGRRGRCAIRGDGTLMCFTFGGVDPPPPEGTFLQVSGALFDVCGLREDGGVACVHGRVGPPPPGPFAQISVDDDYACGIRGSGTWECWGRYTALDGLPEGHFRKVAVGDSSACALGVDDTITCRGPLVRGPDWVVPLSGPFADVDVGLRTVCGLRHDGSVECRGGLEAPEERFVQISVYGERGCGVRVDGTLACWGAAAEEGGSPPRGLFAQVSVGASDACAVSADSRLVCWGSTIR